MGDAFSVPFILSCLQSIRNEGPLFLAVIEKRHLNEVMAVGNKTIMPGR